MKKGNDLSTQARDPDGKFSCKHKWWENVPVEERNKRLMKIDGEKVYDLAALGARVKQIALMHHVTPDSFSSCSPLMEKYEEGRAAYELSILGTQREVAVVGKSEKMLIHLGEVELGQVKSPDIAIQQNINTTRLPENWTVEDIINAATEEDSS